MEAVKFYRKRSGLTQQALAALAGVDQGVVSRVENGLYEPGPSAARKLAAALGLEVWELMYAEQMLERRMEVERDVEEMLTAV